MASAAEKSVIFSSFFALTAVCGVSAEEDELFVIIPPPPPPALGVGVVYAGAEDDEAGEGVVLVVLLPVVTVPVEVFPVEILPEAEVLPVLLSE